MAPIPFSGPSTTTTTSGGGGLTGRQTFPDEGSRLLYSVSAGKLAAFIEGTVIFLYADAAGTTRADCQHPNGVAVSTNDPLLVDGYSRMPLFKGPDGVDTVYAQVNGGPITPVYSRFDDRLDALSVTVTGSTAASSPGAPTIGTAAAGNGKATISFSPPVSDGGTAITSYKVTASTGQTGSGAASPVTVTGLTNDVAVTFTVKAINAAGTSPASAASNAVTPTAPTVWSGAPAYVHSLGTASLIASGSSITLTTTVAATTGNTVLLGIVANGAAVPTVSDSAGNTYGVDIQTSNGTATTTYLVSALNVFGLPSGAAITINFDSARTLVAVEAHEIGGVKDVNTDPGDGSSVGTGNSATALATGNIATTAGNDFVFSVFGATSNAGTAPAFTPGTGYTAADHVQAAASGSSREMWAQYKIQAALGTVTSSATLATAKSYAAVTWIYAASDPGTASVVSNAAYVQPLGTGTTTASSTTTVVTTTAAAAAGDAIVVAVTCNGAPTATVTDSASNTYALDGSIANGTATGVFLFSARSIAALASGGTITVTYNTARTTATVQAHQLTGVGTGTDGSGTGAPAASTSFATQAITTTAPKDLIFAVFGMAGNNTAQTFTPGSGFTTAGASLAGLSTASRDMLTEYQVVTASGTTVTPSASTASSAKTYAGVSVAYGAGTGGATQTGTVTTITALQSAVNAAIPGDTITLASSTTYSGRLVIAGLNGTAAHPITITGASTSILNGGSNASGYGVSLDQCSYVVLSGFAITLSQKGVMVDRSNHVTVDGLTVSHIGNEGIHLRNETVDSIVQNCIISHTGEANDLYGESMYCGTATSNWGSSTRKPAAASGFPDLCHRNKFLNNTCSTGTGECIDIKEGTLNGLVQGNNWDGTTIAGANSADSWVDVKGGGWTLKGNTGNTIMTDGYQTHVISIPKAYQSAYTNWDGTSQPGVSLGNNNIFDGNTSHCAPATGYGFNMQSGSTGNKVYTNNVVDGAPAGTANITLTTAP